MKIKRIEGSVEGSIKGIAFEFLLNLSRLLIVGCLMRF